MAVAPRGFTLEDDSDSAIFSVVYGVLNQPLPYPDSGRLITLTHRSVNTDQARLPASTAIYFTYRDHNQSFDSVALGTSEAATITGARSFEDVRARHHVRVGHNVQIQMVASLRGRRLRTPLKWLMTLVLRGYSCGCGGVMSSWVREVAA